MHVYFDRILADIVLPLVQAFHQGVLAHDTSRPHRKYLENRELARGDIDALTVDQGAASLQIEHQAPERYFVLCNSARAAYERAYARHELAHFERLRQIVVSADVQTLYAVVHRIARGEHEHWNVRF